MKISVIIQKGGMKIDLAEGVEIGPDEYRILYRTVSVRRCPGNTLSIHLECDESGTLNANNGFTCHLNFVGF